MNVNNRSGAFLRLESMGATPTQEGQYIFESRDNLYYHACFCDLERRTEPRLHWFDFRSGVVYEVEAVAEN